MILYFGCRYVEEWKELQDQLQQADKQGLFEIHYAFSRSPGTEKTYVQDLISSIATIFWACCLESRHRAIFAEVSI